jgi:hypothetical protein
MPKIAGCHQKVRVMEHFPITALRSQSGQHLDLRLLVSRRVRQYIFVFYTVQFVVHC